MKYKLQGIVVTDADEPNGRQVKVRYRLPETEVSNLSFPIIVISHQNWHLANDREHRGLIQLPYAPEGQPPWWDDSGGASVATFNPNNSPYQSYFPLPYNFDYQIDVYTRFVRDHMLPIVATLAQPNRLDPKFGYLDIPQDGTKRTMQLLGRTEVQEIKDENDKRLFRVTYLMRVFSELVPALIQSVLATSVKLNLSVYSSTANLTSQGVTEARGILSVGASSSWNIF